MKKYHSIEQFRSAIRKVKSNHDYQGVDENGDAIYSHSTPYPKLKFRGTTKIHGTNAGIVLYKNGKIDFQSRERVLNLEADNAGFMLSMMNKDLNFLWDNIEFSDSIAVYGEWCGGNIQKGVAINGLPKMFIIFGYKVDDTWTNIYPQSNEQGIYNVTQFPTYDVEIDFESPELIQNKLIEMTLEVEEECPVGKYFGVSGVGEGIVFTSVDNPEYQFKSKGEKHSVSKVKSLNAVDVELLEEVKDFVTATVTENRLEQGLQYLQEMGLSLEPKSTGEFISWVVRDVIKEETDTIVSNQLDVKRVKSAVSVAARMWFLSKI